MAHAVPQDETPAAIGVDSPARALPWGTAVAAMAVQQLVGWAWQPVGAWVALGLVHGLWVMLLMRLPPQRWWALGAVLMASTVALAAASPDRAAVSWWWAAALQAVAVPLAAAAWRREPPHPALLLEANTLWQGLWRAGGPALATVALGAVLQPQGHWWALALAVLLGGVCALPALLALDWWPQRQAAFDAALTRSQEAQRQAQALFRDAPALLYGIDAQGVLRQVNRRWLMALQWREAEVLGRPLREFLSAQSVVAAQSLYTPGAAAHASDEPVPVQLRRRDGSLMDALVTPHWERDTHGHAVRCLALVEDVAERNQLAARGYFAEHDPLTGLPNRVLLDDRIRSACLMANRTGQPFALGFLDLDHFKEVNDLHGHEAGDQLLREVAHRLLGAVREVDTVSRLAGDEFVLVLPGMAESRFALPMGRRVLDHLVRQPVQVQGADGLLRSLTVSGSLGLAIYGADAKTPEALLQRADEAMYEAKRAGRNAVVCRPAAQASVA